MKLALVQICSGDNPAKNLEKACAFILEAARAGAELIVTPEVTNCVSLSRDHQRQVLQTEAQDLTLAQLRKLAEQERIRLLIGSLALKNSGPDDRFSNRCFLIDPQGQIQARYDKIHMFDVTLSSSESYKESDGYKPGDRAVLSQTPFGALGMTICYDLRFPQLYRDLAQKGAQLISVPAAFSCTTGPAHWEILLRARAIETGCFLLAAAQSGTHATSQGAARRTYGHSMVISPWGEVLLNLKSALGFGLIDLNLADVDTARNRVPSLRADTQYAGPLHE
jgi:predicted amidohydrolase